jgi:UDP-N-acetylmuramoylalanine--D-glutamate ligase
MDVTVVVGIGRSGTGAARLLHSQGRRVVVVDSADSEPLRERAADLRHDGVDVRLGCPLDPAALLGCAPQGGGIERVVVSPGVAWDHPCLVALRRRGIRIDGEMVPAWESLGGVPWIGITGTNGKTTVTQLLHHLLVQAGRDAPMCGNVGHSATELALSRAASGLPEMVVAELSSYQIEAAACIRPEIGIWTTLTPDHLDRHGTLENYRAIKRGLLERSRIRILNADDPDIAASAGTWDDARWVTARAPAALSGDIQPFLWVENGRIRCREGDVMPIDALSMPGEHNRQNMLLTCAAALCVGVDPRRLEAGYRSFPGVPHRLEFLRELNGLRIFNDSKATNYDAAAVALQAVEGPVTLLAGGQAKEGDAAGWIQQLVERGSAVVLYGASRRHLADLLHRGGYRGPVEQRQTLAEAVPVACDLARRHGARSLLLSPACASFDQFRDFEDRGDQFRRLIADL